MYYMMFVFMINLFSFSQALNRIWISFLFVVAILSVYFTFTDGISYDRDMIRNVVNTNLQEAKELIGFKFIIYSLVSLVLYILFYRLYISKLQKNSLRSFLAIFVVMPIVFFSMSNIYLKYYYKFIQDDSDSIAPIAFLRAAGDYIRVYNREKNIEKKDISNQFIYDKKVDQPLVVVAVIGESARGDRFSLNGYQKKTNPLLEQIKNIISFKDAESCDTSTLGSVPCMVSRSKRDEFSFPVKEVGFVNIFSSHNFDTYWITDQNEAHVIKTFGDEANKYIKISNSKKDEDLLPIYNEIIKNIKKDTLIVIHTLGSHFDYNLRVPQKFKKFKPLCLDDEYAVCDKKSLDNSYDNTILYTDFFLYNLIKPLEDKYSFFIYSSDHGESLGEKQFGIFPKYKHGLAYDIAPKEQKSVPFIFWASDEFLKYHSIKKNIGKLQISHDFFYHSILKCAGFRSKYIDDSLSICK